MLRRTRLLKGWSVERLGEEAGVDFKTIYRHEVGEVRGYQPATALLIADALEVGLEDIFQIERGRWVDKKEDKGEEINV